MKLGGAITKGRFVPDSPTDWSIAARHFEGKRVTVEIEVRRERRSTQANNRYWLLVELAMALLSKTRDVPLSKEQAHYVLVSAFAGCEETNLGLVPVRTSSMDTAQFAAYCEKVEAWLADNDYYLPADWSIEASA